MSESKKTSIWDALKKRYPDNEFVLMAEVSDAAGTSRSRSLDYMAVGLYPSRGLHITGIELKSHRGDWLNELKNPKKQENHFKHCDYFYLLTADEHVAKLEEIPETWGWLCMKNSIIKVIKKAPKLTPLDPSKHFMVAMLKRASSKDNFVHVDSIKDRIEQVKQSALSMRDREIKRQEQELKDLKKLVKEFEEAAGVRFGTWGNYQPSEIGKAVKFINDYGVKNINSGLVRMKETLEVILQNIDNSIKSANEMAQREIVNNIKTES